MPKQIRTRPVTPQQARAYLGKAEEYLEAARAELEAGRAIAAASLAVHAGINAADAVTGMRLGLNGPHAVWPSPAVWRLDKLRPEFPAHQPGVKD